MRNSEFLRLCMQFPHMQATQSCVPMTVNPTPMPVLFPCHRHLTFGRQLCSNMGKSERNIYGSEFPRHQLHNRYTRTSLADNTNCGFTATPKQQDRRANTGTKKRKGNASDQSHDHAVLAVELLHESISREWNARDLLFRADIPPGRW